MCCDLASGGLGLLSVAEAAGSQLSGSGECTLHALEMAAVAAAVAPTGTSSPQGM